MSAAEAEVTANKHTAAPIKKEFFIAFMAVP
jgi:hypothetical protein